MADSGAEIHSSVLAWMKLWSVSVFQLLLIYLESTLHCVNSPTAEGTVLQLIFIPSSSFLFPPFFCVITICCSNKMPKPVIYLFWVLTEKRWALIIDQNSNRCAGIRFFTCMVLLNVGWGGSVPAVHTGTLPRLCKLTVLLRLGSMQRSLLTAKQPRHFLSKLAGGLLLDKNKPSRKASLGCIKAASVR